MERWSCDVQDLDVMVHVIIVLLELSITKS